MIPLLVTLVGLAAIGICLYVLKRTGGAAWKRKFREAAEADRKTFADDETVG